MAKYRNTVSPSGRSRRTRAAAAGGADGRFLSAGAVSPEASTNFVAAFRKVCLSQSGYVEGRNVASEFSLGTQ
jgi:hypothetical protein